MVQTRRFNLIAAFAAALIILSGTPAAALAASAENPAQSGTKQEQIRVADQRIKYTITADRLTIRSSEGEPSAELSFVAYTKDDSDPTKRPVTFLWDGGPGGATFAENFMGFGPRRYFPDSHRHAGPPYQLQPNPHTLLTHTDLVFIDPVGTGYSQALGASSDRDFWGVEPDADAMSAAVIRYLQLNGRWQSPKFLMGTSYGTTRSSIVAHKLQSSAVAVNGVILVASALNFGMQDNGMDQQFTLTLPTLAAIAWHHGKTAHQNRSLREFLEEVGEFARTEYASALYLGNRISAEQKRALAQKLSGYIGLDAQYIHDAHLRVSAVRFRKALLRDAGKVIGRMDGRTLMADFDTVGEEPESDYWIIDEFVLPARAIVEDFYGREMGLETTQNYNMASAGAALEWTWQHDLPNVAGLSRLEIQERNILPQNTWVAAHLSAAMRANRNLRVFQAHGYFDLATPYAWGDYDLSHMTHNPQLMDRVTTAYYDAGHVIYFDEKVVPRLSNDLRKFYDDALTVHPHP